MTTRTGGVLVSIDGPGGVGKTTTIEHLTALLRRAGLRVHRTAQPSASPIGALACDLVPTAGGAALACLFAADRYHQLDTEIRPHLDDGEIVLCDRYLASGLVVQRADGLDLAFLAEINQRTDRPDLAVILTADPNTIAGRLAERGVHNRYQGSPVLAANELTHYRDAGRPPRTPRRVRAVCRHDPSPTRSGGRPGRRRDPGPLPNRARYYPEGHLMGGASHPAHASGHYLIGGDLPRSRATSAPTRRRERTGLRPGRVVGTFVHGHG